MDKTSVRPDTLTDPGPSWQAVLINLVLFQVAWFACVLGGAWGEPLVGIAVVAAVAAYHLAQARRPWAEAALLAAAGLIGATWDGQLAGHGWLVYASGELAPWVAPSWIIAMWIAFATTLNLSLRWLRGRYGLALLFGALGGPLAYVGGERLGGVAFPDTLVALAAIGAGWALISPALVWLASRLDGFAMRDDTAVPALPAGSSAGAEP
jgi:hypothetical protein